MRKTKDNNRRSLQRMVRPRTTRRIMRRRPGVWLVAHDNPRCGRVGSWTIYTVRFRRSDGVWYHNYNTKEFAWALKCWKRECAHKWPNDPSSATRPTRRSE